MACSVNGKDPGRAWMTDLGGWTDANGASLAAASSAEAPPRDAWRTATRKEKEAIEFVEASCAGLREQGCVVAHTLLCHAGVFG